MKFTIDREALLQPLQLVAGVVERRQTLPVLSNALVVLDDGGELALTGTDLEVEIVGRTSVESGDAGETTLPARKLLDICRSLPDGAEIEIAVDGQRATIKSGRSRFTLSTLPPRDFPNVEEGGETARLTVSRQLLKRLIDRTAFSMAQQDVRFYLNGMLVEFGPDMLRVVATDGHRLALATAPTDTGIAEATQAIVPRKGILELARLLGDGEGDVELRLGANHLRVVSDNFTFTSKLVDGKYPDYERVIPKRGDKEVLADRETLRQTFSRVAILSNEKYRGVRLQIESGQITCTANNPDQEQAEEVVSVDYSGDGVDIGFNISYLLDVLNTLKGETAKITLTDSNSSALIQDAASDESLYVVMPMRL